MAAAPSSTAVRSPASVLADQAADREFLARGYLVRPFLGPGELQAVARLHEECYPTLTTDFTATTLDESFERRWRVSTGLRAIVGATLARLLPRHRMVLGTFVTKRAQTRQGRVPLHQDWWVVDNRVQRALHVWCPLVDVGLDTGCLTVVPGVHELLGDSPYPIHPKYRTAFHPVLSAVSERFAKRIPMRAGSALFYDQRMLHGSEENQGQHERVAFNCIMVPEDAEPLLYLWEESAPKRFEVLGVDEAFLCRFRFGTPVRPPYPDGTRWLTSVEDTSEPWRDEDLEALRRVQERLDA